MDLLWFIFLWIGISGVTTKYMSYLKLKNLSQIVTFPKRAITILSRGKTKGKRKRKKKKEKRGLKIKDWRRKKSIKQESRNESTNLSHVTNFLLWDFCKKKIIQETNEQAKIV